MGGVLVFISPKRFSRVRKLLAFVCWLLLRVVWVWISINLMRSKVLFSLSWKKRFAFACQKVADRVPPR